MGTVSARACCSSSRLLTSWQCPRPPLSADEPTGFPPPVPETRLSFQGRLTGHMDATMAPQPTGHQTTYTSFANSTGAVARSKNPTAAVPGTLVQRREAVKFGILLTNVTWRVSGEAKRRASKERTVDCFKSTPASTRVQQRLTSSPACTERLVLQLLRRGAPPGWSQQTP